MESRINLKCYHCNNSDIKLMKSCGWNNAHNKRRFKCLSCNKKFTIINITEYEQSQLNWIIEKRRAQKYQDKNRLNAKDFREWSKTYNAIEEYNKELIKYFKTHNNYEYTIKHNIKESEGAAIIHFTDPHFNELVDLEDNQYNFEIASKRCKKFINLAKQFLEPFKVKNILFAMTGDLLNSDRRPDELLNEAGNRAEASFIAAQIIEQMILDLNKNYNVYIKSVIGNESRIPDEIGWTDIVASNNYDCTIFNMLRYYFKDANGIYFLNGNIQEDIVGVNNKNVLMIHGHQKYFTKDKPTTAINQLFRKNNMKNKNVHFVIFGHNHECYIGDTFARGASIVGANEYSDYGLGLTSKASQNIHIITDDSIHSIKIDLQDVSNIVGYKINNPETFKTAITKKNKLDTIKISK